MRLHPFKEIIVVWLKKIRVRELVSSCKVPAWLKLIRSPPIRASGIRSTMREVSKVLIGMPGKDLVHLRKTSKAWSTSCEANSSGDLTCYMQKIILLS